MAVSVLGVVLCAASLRAADRVVDKSFPFQLERWYELDAKEGPVTLHRIRLEKGGAGVKSKVLGGGGGSPFETPLILQVECSNVASRDWQASFRVEWTDEEGEVIDGYHGEKELDAEKQFERINLSLSTLRYGLARARKLKVAIDVRPD
jgi:hypothetical protein